MSRRLLIELGVVAALVALAALGFQPMYGGAVFALPVFGGLVVGLGSIVLARRLNQTLITGVVIAIAAYVLFGSALAMPTAATFGVLPNLETLDGLVRGAVFGWSDAVTLTVPLEAPPYIPVLAYFATWACAVITGAIVAYWPVRQGSGSALRRVVATAVPLALLIATIVLGTHLTFLAGARGVLFTAIALVWVCSRAGSDAAANVASRSAAARRRLIGVGTVVLGALIAGSLVGAVVQPATAKRVVARDEIVPPFDPLDYPSPLAAFRHYVNDQTKTTLFTEDGLTPGSYVRIATMDSWDGVVWNVSRDAGTADGSGAFRLLGTDLPQPKLFTPGATTKANITIKGYSGVWLPDASYPTGLSLEGPDASKLSQNLRVNTETGTVALTSGVKSGLSYDLDVTALEVPNDKALAAIPAARVDAPTMASVPDVVASTAKQYAGGATTALQTLDNLQKSLVNQGYLSHGRASDPVPSRAGEGADRVEQLLTQSPMVGDQEQYVTAFALMAHSLGYPVRVVLGAKVPKKAGLVPVTGNDVTAWDEVAFEGVGWVPFFPTPTKTDAPKDQTVKPKIIPQPQVRQPPRDHPKDDQLLTPVQTKDQDKKKTQDGLQIPAWAYWAGGSLLLLLAIVFLPLLVVWLLRKRRRRKRAGGPVDRRAAGAWAELASGFRELGLDRPGHVATRTQLVRHYETSGDASGVAVQPGVLGPLARRVDHAVFSAGQLADETADALWKDVDGVLTHARGGLGWVRRRLSDYRYSRS
ncbi:transglutaminase domain-containing protein [Gryllotalpicola protaetiae]|uniref:Transglutaminase domain-containing protein n=1 Tax=Gryllotalpicola protaetiae TaxID=2419771 RepID=A0A387BK98_9MICO|nr:transglutaminase domain-containing protein [Gryllotalpicola protaetiae]AYG03068.1 transglutaminase domain-containing protein [Gryllotalpicola protaetiae]